MNRNVLIGSLLGILILLVWAFWAVTQMPSTRSQASVATQLQVPDNMGGRFTLTDQDGKKVFSETFKDKYKLVYFGFTSCPAICPTELQKISKAMKALGADASKVQPLFISVDPERDTPAVLKDYVPMFNMGLVGLTGSKDDIENIKRQFRVYAAKVVDPNASDYSVDHSSYIYLLDHDDKVVDLFKTEDNATVIADRVRPLLKP